MWFLDVEGTEAAFLQEAIAMSMKKDSSLAEALREETKPSPEEEVCHSFNQSRCVHLSIPLETQEQAWDKETLSSV